MRTPYWPLRCWLLTTEALPTQCVGHRLPREPAAVDRQNRAVDVGRRGRAEEQEEAYHLNVRKLEQGLISTIDFQKASDNWLNAKTSRLDALLKFYIKRSVVNYYNGISYIDQ